MCHKNVTQSLGYVDIGLGRVKFNRKAKQKSCALAEKGKRGMEKSVVTLQQGAHCSSWNYCGQRLAVGSIDGTLSIFDSSDPSSSIFTPTWKSKVRDACILKIAWIPPEYGDAVACVCSDGSCSIWEEVEDSQSTRWILCKQFEVHAAQVLDLQFGFCLTSLKMIVAYSNGDVKVYKVQDPLELNKWELQAEFRNVIDSLPITGKVSCQSASISWNPQRVESQQPSFVLGFNSDLPKFNSSKVWEFDEAHQRWLPVAELSLPEERGDQVYAVAWAPNIGRPYEVIAVATSKGIAIWHLGLNPDTYGKLSVEKVASLSGHEGEVWQMEWDMSGMTLASAGSDGAARLWQSNLNGVWHEQATLETASS